MKILSKRILNRTKKLRSIIFLLSAILVAAGIFLAYGYFTSKPTSASWFNENWLYRQAITITVASSTSDTTNVNTLIPISTSTLISSSKLQSSCQDLRFTNASGKLLTYYIDAACNTTSTEVVVQIDLVPKNTTTYTLYMYYGNSSAPAGSNSSLSGVFNGLSKGLVGYWAMNESSWTNDCSTSTVRDISGSSNHAKSCPNTTGPTGGATGKYGNGASLSGSNDINIPDTAALRPGTGTWSTALWFQAANQDWNAPLLVKRLNSSPYTQWNISIGTADSGGNNNASKKISAWLISSYPTQAIVCYTNNNVVDGNWHHVVVTRDTDGYPNFYIDGAAYARTCVTDGGTHPDNINDADPWYVGFNNVSTYFTGSIDEVRIYNRALSSTEVSTLYNNPGTITTSATASAGSSPSFATEEQGPGPVGYWTFDEGVDNTCSGGSNDVCNSGSLGSSGDGGKSGALWKNEDVCLSGKCLWFDGNNDTLSMSSSANLNPGSDSFTVSAWVRPNGLQSGNQTGVIKNEGGTDYWIFELNGSNVMAYDIRDNSGGGNYFSGGGNTALNNNQWNHIAYIIDRTNQNIYLYLNGRLDKTISISTMDEAISPTGGITVGAHVTYLKGFLDDLKIYKYARSADQVKQDYSSGLSNAGTNQGTSAVMGTKTEKYLSDGLVGYWKMDDAGIDAEGETLTDSSGNSSSGTLAGDNGAGDNGTGLDCTAVGKFGTGCSLDGTDDYIGANYNNLNFTDNGTFTISVWVKPDTLSSAWRRGIIVQESYLTSGYRFGFSNGGAPIFWTSQSGGTLSVASSIALTINQWNHIVVTYNNQQAYIYLNGIQTGSGTGTYLAGSAETRIGYVVNEYFSGSMDDIRMYNRSLSPKEVSDLYNWAPGPVGYWDFEDGSGTNAIDSSGNGYTASLTASPPWRAGKYGKAIEVNGSTQDARVANTAFGLTGGSFTLEAWVKSDAVDASSNKRIIAYATDSNNGYTLAQYVTGSGCNGRWTFEVKKSGTGYAAGCDSTNNALVVANTWYHLAATFDGSSNTSTLYVNGIKQAAGSGIAYGVPGTTGTLYIGSTAGSSWFDGLIDEVRVYNYARTQKQVVSDMNAGHTSVGSPVGSAVGYWDFDEGVDNICSGGTNDVCNSGSAGSALDGAESSMAVPATSTSGWTQSGKFGRALNFDGTGDYISIADNAALKPSSAITISMWIYPTAFNNSGANSYPTIIAKGDQNTRLFFDTSGVLSSRFSGFNDLAAKTAVSLNTWTHVVLTYGGAGFKMYFNGVLNNSDSQTGSLSTDTSTLTIGNWNSTSPGTNTRYFQGTIDEVKFYDYALTDDEVKTEYNKGSSLLLGAAGDNATYAANSANQEYCVPGDSTSCAAPVGRWDFEERTGANAYDTSGNGRTGTITEASWTTGKVGSGLNFDGSNDVVSVGDNDVLDMTTTMSFEAWIYPTATSAYDPIIGKVDSSYNTGYEFANSSGTLRTTIRATAGNCDYSAGTLTVNTWQHVASTYDGTNTRHYINGVLQGTSGSCTYGSTANALALLIAGRGSDSSKYIGKIDQVRVFNYQRSAAQIAWDYNRGGPVGYWDLDDCQGTTAYDQSGNSNNGTLTATSTVGTCTTASTFWGGSGGTGAGKKNYAPTFNGTGDYLTLPSIATNFTTGFSVCAWTYFTNTGAWSRIIDFSESGSANDNILFARNSTSSDLTYEVYVGSGSGGKVTATGAITNNTWIHLCATEDGSGNVVLYKNGANIKTGTTGVPANVTRATNYIAKSNWGADALFGGQLDDVKIFNYALTPTQIKTLYQGGGVVFGPSTGSP